MFKLHTLVHWCLTIFVRNISVRSRENKFFYEVFGFLEVLWFFEQIVHTQVNSSIPFNVLLIRISS